MEAFGRKVAEAPSRVLGPLVSLRAVQPRWSLDDGWEQPRATSSSEIFGGGWLAMANHCGRGDCANVTRGQRLELGRELLDC